MNVLITGSLGYIGSEIAKYFLQNRPQLKLFGVDLGWFASDIIVEDNCDRFYERIYFKNISSITSNDLENIDAVINLAAISNDPIGNEFSDLTDLTNCKHNIKLATQCAIAGVKNYVFASSCSIYGFADDTPKTETDEVAPITAYAHSKINSEQYLKHIDSKMNITCFRFATAWGFSPRFRTDLVVNDFIFNAIRQNEIFIQSDGSPIRPIISVKDMARAFLWAIENNEVFDQKFNVVNAGYNNQNFSVKEISEVVALNFNKCNVNLNPKNQPDKRSYKVNFDKFENLTGFKEPLYSLEAGVQITKNQLLDSKITFDENTFLYLKRLNKLKLLLGKELIKKDLEWI